MYNGYFGSLLNIPKTTQPTAKAQAMCRTLVFMRCGLCTESCPSTVNCLGFAISVSPRVLPARGTGIAVLSNRRPWNPVCVADHSIHVGVYNTPIGNAGVEAYGTGR